MAIRSRTKTRSIDRGYKRIIKELKILERKPYVKIGFPAQKDETKQGKEFNVPGEEGLTLINDFVTVLDVAIWQEFGTIYMPERSFIRAAFDKNRSKYLKLNEKLLKDIYIGKKTVSKALDILGLTIQNDIKEFIRTGEVTPKSIRAIDEGGTTLYDTGQLINSITYVKVMNP